MSVIGNIKRQYGDMFKAEKRAADFILKYPEQLIEQNYSISELAKKCAASEASIIRMCKRIGYSGFSQFKITLARELELQNEATASPHDQERPYDVVSYINQLTKEIQFCARNIDFKSIQECVDVILASDSITTVAWGNTNSVAADLATRLSWYSLNAFHTDLPDYAIRHISLMSERGALIAISHYGNSHFVIETMKFAKKRGIHTILITNTPNQPAERYADHLLCIGSTGFSIHRFGCESHVIESIVIDILLFFLQERLRNNKLPADEEAELLIAKFHRYLYLISK